LKINQGFKPLTSGLFLSIYEKNIIAVSKEKDD